MDPVVTTDQPLPTDKGFVGSPTDGHIQGLEILQNMKEVRIKQQRPGCLELLQCWEYANKYKVLDENKEQIFLLKEESDCLARYCCNNIRPLEGSFQNMSGQEILRFKRPLRCLGCCIPSCYPDYTQLLEIYHQNELLGRVREVPICCFSRKHLEVWDKKDQKIFDISGPCCPVSCGGSVPFPIEDSSGTNVGEISKQWRGFFSEAFTDTDTFKIEFPDSITLETKAILIGATMLVDYMFFEKQNNDNTGGDGGL